MSDIKSVCVQVGVMRFVRVHMCICAHRRLAVISALSDMTTHHRYDNCLGRGREGRKRLTASQNLSVRADECAGMTVHTVCVCVVIMPKSDNQLCFLRELTGGPRLSHRCKSHKIVLLTDMVVNI